MANKEILARVKHKRDTSSNWTQNNPVLLNGEIILVDTAEGELRAKIGDGVKTYTRLPFSDETLRSLINDNKVTVDDALSSTSTNPVQNKAVTTEINSIKTLVGDTSVSEQIISAIANKVDKVDGKGLSTNDYTTDEKNKLSGIAAGAEVNVKSNWTVTDTNSDAFIMNKPSIDSGVATYSIQEGYGTSAIASYSHAEGLNTVTRGNASHAEGSATQAGLKVFSVNSFNEESKMFTLSSVEGLEIGMYYSLYTGGECILNCGSITAVDTNNNTITVDTFPEYANTAAHLFIDGEDLGDTNHGLGSHAEGIYSYARGKASHAEGSSSAWGDYSHAEGNESNARGKNSHAEGSGTNANGYASHTEGQNTTAVDFYCHAEGHATDAGQQAFLVKGLTPGEGTTGTLTLSSIEGLSVGKRYSTFLDGECILNCGQITVVNTDNTSITVDSYPDRMHELISALDAPPIYIGIVDAPYLGDSIIGYACHAEGKGTLASGQYSHAEGRDTIAAGDHSHAEGDTTVASGLCSHAEGFRTQASGPSSHAEGHRTQASGPYSHAEGHRTQASGPSSHAEGKGAVASGLASHVQGRYNIEGDYADIIGNGDDDNARSNAATVDWLGNAWYAGDVYVGSTSGTNKDAGSRKLIAVAPNAGAHNAIYRGDSLGTIVTPGQWAAIKSGTFEDMYIGDYWTIGGVVYRIAAFNYYYSTGDKACTNNHITLVPEANMYDYVMNDTNTTTGAYVGSKMYTKGLAQAKTTINSAFGQAHILNHRQYLHNAVTDGYTSGASWYDSTVELMTEQNVYGSKVYGNQLNGTARPNSHTIDKSQYPLFAFRPDMQHTASWFWLRDVASATGFAVVNDYGNAHYSGAENTRGVRPAFSIYQS